MAEATTITDDITPHQFHERFIARRQPVIVSAFTPELSYSSWEDLNYLLENAGEAEVLVEPINTTSKTFGSGVKRIKMPFSKFLQSLSEPNGENYYLTTQYDEEEPQRIPTPLPQLRKDIVLQPALCGNLVLQQMNLWIGRSKQGSSSGLHHDHSDNLYLLIRGSKRFVLYPPSSAPYLYPHGEVEKIHDNGLISYTSSPIRADGLSPRHFAELEVEALEAVVDACKDDQDRAALEEKLDEAQERLMDFMILQNGDHEADAYDELNLGDMEDEEEGGNNALGDNLEEESESENDDSGPLFPVLDSLGGPINDEDDEENQQPSSFSRIPSAALHAHLKLAPQSQATAETLKNFPLLKKAKPLIVNLKAGQMLYLPASWFHEVTSTSSNASEPHMALNYWFHPPDTKDFEQPYEAALIWDHIRVEQRKEDLSTTSKGKKRAALSPENESSKKLKV